MNKLSYHGRTIEQALWVMEHFGTPEMREFYKDNQSFNEWLRDCETVIESERLNY